MNSHSPIERAKQIDLVEYLATLGYQACKVRAPNYWYLSPLRTERRPSFKVNRRINAWYDHGLGRGGNIIDFGILYHKCSVKEFLARLGKPLSFHRNVIRLKGASRPMKKE